MLALAPGAAAERELSWLDWSLPIDISADGTRLLFDEQGAEGGSAYTVAMRVLTGSPPVRLGEGMAGDLSADGKWTTTLLSNTRMQLLPTGTGSARPLEPGGIQQYWHGAHWLPDGKQIVFPANLPGRPARCFIQDVAGGKPRPVTPEAVTGCQVSPDGKLIAGTDFTGATQLYPLDGAEPRAVAGLAPGESFAWTADPNFMYAYLGRQTSARVYRLNILTGERQLFRQITPPDLTGLCDISHLHFSADGRAYVYSHTRVLSELYIANGLK